MTSVFMNISKVNKNTGYLSLLPSYFQLYFELNNIIHRFCLKLKKYLEIHGKLFMNCSKQEKQPNVLLKTRGIKHGSVTNELVF